MESTLPTLPRPAPSRPPGEQAPAVRTVRPPPPPYGAGTPTGTRCATPALYYKLHNVSRAPPLPGDCVLRGSSVEPPGPRRGLAWGSGARRASTRGGLLEGSPHDRASLLRSRACRGAGFCRVGGRGQWPPGASLGREGGEALEADGPRGGPLARLGLWSGWEGAPASESSAWPPGEQAADHEEGRHPDHPEPEDVQQVQEEQEGGRARVLEELSRVCRTKASPSSAAALAGHMAPVGPPATLQPLRTHPAHPVAHPPLLQPLLRPPPPIQHGDRHGLGTAHGPTDGHRGRHSQGAGTQCPAGRPTLRPRPCPTQLVTAWPRLRAPWPPL